MELFLNDCSLHGQFFDLNSFNNSLSKLMELRKLAGRYGRSVYCHRNILSMQVTPSDNLKTIVGRINLNKRRLLLSWLTKEGPYWDVDRQHSPDEYFESNGQVVTDTGVGESAYLVFSGREIQLTSFKPSDWEGPHYDVQWFRGDTDVKSISLLNHVEVDTLEPALASSEPLIKSWDMLSDTCRQRFQTIHFSDDAFTYLKSSPFNPGVAVNIMQRLDVLHQLKCEFKGSGQRTDLGNQIYENHCTGDKAWFSDSSEPEKNSFKNQLTFSHPEKTGESVFASWHGKIKSPQMRIHFDWDFSRDNPLYVVYIGPKITKR